MASNLVNTNSLPASRRRVPRTRRLASLALGLLVAAAVVTGTSHAWPTRAAGYKPQLREFTLTASEFDWEIEPGKTVKAWGYNNQVPGPEIRVTEGDEFRITLINTLPTGTTTHWHGLEFPPAMDGPAGLNQAEVEPG